MSELQQGNSDGLNYRVLSKYFFRTNVILVIALLSPFFCLAFFTIPSIDDYQFAQYVREHGLLGTPIHYYQVWTGRFSAMTLLSLHASLLDYVLSYRVIILLMMLLSWHAIFYFIRSSLQIKGVLKSLLFSGMLLFAYVSIMPEMVQGFFWVPGAITYQLGNLLMLYFSGIVLKYFFQEEATIPWYAGLANALLIVVVCGLNETAMVLMCFISGSAILYYVLKHKRINAWLAIYFLLAMASSIAVYVAPGNDVRAAQDAGGRLSPDVLKAIIASISSSGQLLGEWLSSGYILALSFIFLLFLSAVKPRISLNTRSIQVYVIGVLWLFGLIVLSVFPVQYVYGELTPRRSINITCWLFIISWMIVLWGGYLITGHWYRDYVSKYLNGFLIIGVLLLLATGLNKTERLYLAWDDLLSGRAAAFAAQFQERDEILRSCTDHICTYPGFTVFPKSIFNEAISRDKDNHFTQAFAKFYGHAGVQQEFRDPEFLERFEYDLENQKQSSLSNLASITDEVSNSGRYSSKVKPNSGYSVGFSIPFWKLKVKNIYLLNAVEFSVWSHCPDTNCDASLVMVIVNASGEKVFWKDLPLRTKAEGEPWQHNALQWPLLDEHLVESNELLLYVWNRGENVVYVDDLEVLVY